MTIKKNKVFDGYCIGKVMLKDNIAYWHFKTFEEAIEFAIINVRGKCNIFPMRLTTCPMCNVRSIGEEDRMCYICEDSFIDVKIGNEGGD